MHQMNFSLCMVVVIWETKLSFSYNNLESRLTHALLPLPPPLPAWSFPPPITYMYRLTNLQYHVMDHPWPTIYFWHSKSCNCWGILLLLLLPRVVLFFVLFFVH